MADLKISELAERLTLADTDELAVEAGGTTYKTTWGTIKSKIEEAQKVVVDDDNSTISVTTIDGLTYTVALHDNIADHFDAGDSYKLKPSGLKSQTKTVTSLTAPTPDYIGQPGVDASGDRYVAIALSGTMWEKITNTDTKLDESGSNEVTASEIRTLVNKKELLSYVSGSEQSRSRFKDLYNDAKINVQTGINDGSGALTLVYGGTQANVAYDGDCIFAKADIAYMKRITLTPGENVAIQLDVLFNSATFKGDIAGMWLKKSQLALLNRLDSIYPLTISCTEISNAIISQQFSLQLTDIYLGKSLSSTNGTAIFNFGFYAEYNDWIFLGISKKSISSSSNDTNRFRVFFYNNGSYGSNIDIDILNPYGIDGLDVPILDFIFPETADQLDNYLILPQNYVQNKHLNATVVGNGMLQDNLGALIPDVNGELLTRKIDNYSINKIAEERLVEREVFYNLLDQPTGNSFETQVPGYNLIVTTINNDGTLPFGNEQLAKFYRLTYDFSLGANRIHDDYLGNANNGKYVISFWLRDSDILNITAIGFYDYKTLVFNNFDMSNYQNVGDKDEYIADTVTIKIRTNAKYNGWTNIIYTYEDSLANAVNIPILIKFFGSGSGKIDLCNFTVIPERIVINSFDIYISQTDNVGIVPTFNNKAIFALSESGTIESTINSYLAANPEVVEQYALTTIEKYSYGGKVQNFLSKLRAYKYNRYFSKPLKIIIIGDSITGGSWSYTFESFLNSEYGIAHDDIDIRWYGGAGMQYMIPFLEQIAIFPNPDLVIFNEYEDLLLETQLLIDRFIYMLKNFTTADIAIGTWGIDGTTATTLYNSGNPDFSLIKEGTIFSTFHFYRDLAKKFNCELIDFNFAIIQWILKGNDPSTIMPDPPHLTSQGYETIYTPEIKKHFGQTSWIENSNLTNPNDLKEEELYAFTALLDYFKEGRILFNNQLLWSLQPNRAVRCSTQSEFVEIYLSNSIGFEIISVVKSGGSVNIQIKEEGGVYGNPSDLTFNSKPLQYCSEIVSVTYPNENQIDNWRLKRPFKGAVVNSNVLTDGTLISGQYKIKVKDIGGIVAVDTVSNWVEINGDFSAIINPTQTVKINGSTGNDGDYIVDTVAYQSGTNRTRITMTTSIINATADGYLLHSDNRQFVTCEIIDTNGLTVLDEFIVGYETASILAGAITFPLTYNGEDNYALYGATLDNWGVPANNNFAVGQEYEFYIKSNWINNALMTSQFNKVFGYERGNYWVKLTVNASTTFDFYGIRIFH